MNKPLSPKADGQRARSRGSFLMKAAVRFPLTGEMGEVRVRNLSAGGMMAEAPIAAERGVDIEVQLKNVGWIPAKVAWVEEGRFGVAFSIEIDPALVTAKNSSFEQPAYLRKLDRTAAPPDPRKLRGV